MREVVQHQAGDGHHPQIEVTAGLTGQIVRLRQLCVGQLKSKSKKGVETV
jgi:hypothetical protein